MTNAAQTNVNLLMLLYSTCVGYERKLLQELLLCVIVVRCHKHQCFMLVLGVIINLWCY